MDVLSAGKSSLGSARVGSSWLMTGTVRYRHPYETEEAQKAAVARLHTQLGEIGVLADGGFGRH